MLGSDADVEQSLHTNKARDGHTDQIAQVAQATLAQEFTRNEIKHG